MNPFSPVVDLIDKIDKRGWVDQAFVHSYSTGPRIFVQPLEGHDKSCLQCSPYE